MKHALVLLVILVAAVPAFAQERNTEIQGFYQTYGDFSFNPGEGVPILNVPDTRLNGGGFNLAQNLAPWFAMWTQLSFFGSVDAPPSRVRIINNLQGMRWQKNYGPLRLYGKFGLGFSHFNFEDVGGNVKFSASYGGGVQVWADWIGVSFDASQVFMGVPHLFEADGRDKWDSGIALTTGVAFRF
jgi:hypothetical protein